MRKYSKPPVVEVVCEVRFSDTTNWDKDIIDRIYQNLLKIFQNSEDDNSENVLTISGKESKIESVTLNSIKKEKFFNADKSITVAVSDRFLSISTLNPDYRSYIGWEKFFPTVCEVITVFLSEIEKVDFDRIGLLYVDKFKINTTELNFEDYFNFFPNTKGISHNVVNFQIACDFEFNEGRDICRVFLTSGVPQDKDSLTFLMKTDFFLAKRKGVLKDGLFEWVDTAHILIKKMFDTVVTEKLTETFD